MTNEIAVSPDKETLAGIERREAWAEFLYIATQEEYADATEAIQNVKRGRAAIVELFKDIKSKAHATHAAICKKEKSFLDRFKAIEKNVKAAMIGFQKAEEVRQKAERKRLQAIEDERARVEREAAEAEAARQRAIEDARRAEAEEAMRKSEAEKDELEKERLRVEAEAADKAAREASIRARQERAAAAAVEVETVKAAPVLPSKDTYIKKHWKANLVDMTALVKSAAAGNSVALAFLSFDKKAADSFARKNKDSMFCPGVDFSADTSLAAKGGK